MEGLDKQNNVVTDYVDNTVTRVRFKNLNSTNKKVKIVSNTNNKINQNLTPNNITFGINGTNTSEVTLTRIPVVSEDNTIAMNLFHDALIQRTELSEYLASVQLSMLSMEERLKIIPSEALQSQLQAQIDIINSRLSSSIT